MAFKNITPELERELANALGPEFNVQQQNQLMAFANALLAKLEPVRAQASAKVPAQVSAPAKAQAPVKEQAEEAVPKAAAKRK